MALFATSLNLLVGNTGMVSFGHGMFYGFAAYIFGVDDADDELSVPSRPCSRCGDDLYRAGRRRDLRPPQHGLFRLHHARGADAVLQRHHLLAEPDRRRPGLARRHPAPRDFRLRARLAASSLPALRRRGGARPAGAAPYHGEPVRPDAAHDPRQRGPRELPGRRAVARQALGPSRIAGGFAGLGGVLAALFVSGAYPELADWPNSGQAIFAVMLGGINSFLGPVLGAMILLALNDVVTAFHGISRAGAGHRDPGLRARPAPRRARFHPAGLARTRAMKLEIKNLTKAFGGVRGDRRRVAGVSVRLAVGGDRSERRRQEHLLQPDQRRVCGRCRRRCCSTVRTSFVSPRAERMHRGIGRAFQVASCFPTMTVAENLMAAVTAHVGQWGNLSHRFPPPGMRERADEVMELVGLTAGPTSRPRSFPMATRNCSISPLRSRSNPRCCCSTSRPPAWARMSAGA